MSFQMTPINSFLRIDLNNTYNYKLYIVAIEADQYLMNYGYYHEEIGAPIMLKANLSSVTIALKPRFFTDEIDQNCNPDPNYMRTSKSKLA